MDSTYVIVSPRLGTPGAPWDPPVWVNVHALLEGGFIRRATDPTPTTDTPATAKVSRKRSPDTGPAQED